MPALVKSRHDLATDHLAALRARAAEIDRQGNALVAEHGQMADKIAVAALDAIENKAKAPVLAALRERLAAIPAEIKAVAAEREALERDLAEAQAALDRAGIEEAAETAVRLLDERERLAEEIDGTLAGLAELWSAYSDAGKGLDAALRALGLPRGTAGRYDQMHMEWAVQHAGVELALGVGQSMPERVCVGTMSNVPAPERWANSPRLARSDDSSEVRALLTSAARAA